MAETSKKAEVVPVEKSKSAAATTPAINPFEDMERFFYEAFPGVDKMDIEISLTENTASIKASISKQDEKEDGLLEIVIPKIERARARSIKVA